MIYQRRKRKGWRIVELDKNIETTFREGNKLIKLEFFDSKNKTLLVELLYTPVSKKLIKAGEKIGDLLHSNNHYKTIKEYWFQETKKFLENIYNELEIANRGTLLGPPLYHSELERFDLAIEIYEGYNPKGINIVEGTQVIMNISYPEKI